MVHYETNSDELARVTRVQERYTPMLMQKRNVVGVGVGLHKDDGMYTSHYVLKVLVSHKLGLQDMKPEDTIPDELDGVPVEVQEVGHFAAQA